MTRVLNSPSLSGSVTAIPSKSHVHRLLICAALADTKTAIECRNTSEDIEATARCLSALGAGIKYQNGVYTVEPLRKAVSNARLDCGESGSTLRFLLPVACALSGGADFVMKGRLPQRPIVPLLKELEAHGAVAEYKSGEVLSVSGRLSGCEWSVAADISSQFVSGLLFMLTMTGGRLSLEGRAQSTGYIDMTCRSLEAFGADIVRQNGSFEVKRTCPLRSPSKVSAHGDWSNAAFFITAGVLGKSPITVEGLDLDSAQGDRAIVELLRSMGGNIDCRKGIVTAYPSQLACADIDASQVPDLVPVLAVAAAAANGTSRIFGAERLRLKESDRLESVANMLVAIGATVQVTQDGLVIAGGNALPGGTVLSAGDHRIAMSAAVASTICGGCVRIEGAESVNKSYPGFWSDFGSLVRNS